MPKERRDRSMSFDMCRRSPFSCSCSRRSSPKLPSETEENLKEWEDARCPVWSILTMEFSPYLSSNNTIRSSRRRSSTCKNKLIAAIATSELTITNSFEERTEDGPSTPSIVSCENLVLSKLMYLLCHGEIKRLGCCKACSSFHECQI